MSRMEDELAEIVDACPIEVYSSGINPRWTWPWKLMSYHEAREGVAESAGDVMIDSSLNEVGTVEEIRRAAYEVDADSIILPDVTPESRGESTAESHAEMTAEDLLWLDDHRDDLDVLVPIQAPYRHYVSELRTYDPGFVEGLRDDPAFDWAGEDEEWRWNARGARPTLTLDLIEKADGVAVGGLQSLPSHARVEVLEDVRTMVGSNNHVHALAPGLDQEVISALRADPSLVDSIDLSTPENAVKNGKLPDKTGSQHEHLFPRGVESSTVRAQFSRAVATQIAYMLTPSLCTDSELDGHHERTGLDAFGSGTRRSDDVAWAMTAEAQEGEP